MSNNYGILLMMLMPLLGGCVGFFLGKKNKESRNDLIDIIVVVELAMIAYMGYKVICKGATFKLVLSALFGLGLSLEVNAVSLLLSFITTVVFAVLTQFMKVSMKDEEGHNRFYLFYMGLYSMVLAVFLSSNLYNMSMFMAAAVLFSYGLVLHRRDEKAIRNGGIFLGISVLGFAFLFAGITYIFAYLGSVGFAGMYSTMVAKGGSVNILIGGFLIAIGLSIFAGMFPLQFQVTRGGSHGLMEVSVVMGSVVSKIGIYGLMIIAADLFMGNLIYGRVLLVMALLTAAWGSVISMTSTDIRKILVGLEVEVNGINLIAIALMALYRDAFSVRSAIYMLVVSSMALMTLYMVALEQARLYDTFEIKGLTASGKGNKLLTVAAAIASLSLCGCPATAGFLAHAMAFEVIYGQIKWKWLVALYVLVWAFLMTSVARVFVKIFISKKEETMKILSSEEEVQKEADEQNALEEERAKQKEHSPYFFGEILLTIIAVLQIVVGLLPGFSVDKFATEINNFFHGGALADDMKYYTGMSFAGFFVALVICIFLYLNLVHGILLRGIRDSKNKKLKKQMEVETDVIEDKE